MSPQKNQDHKSLGRKLELFSFSEVAPGMAFWWPKGVVLFDIIIHHLRDKLAADGYQEVRTPLILDKSIWQKSGHYEHYQDLMFFTDRLESIKNPHLAVKPMNCPGTLILYKEKTHSYKELPLKISELGMVHRYEISGVLNGLFRCREFTIDDAHVFCLSQQTQEEVGKLVKFIEGFYVRFGFSDVAVELSTRPKKSIGTDEQWRMAEGGLRDALKKLGKKYKENPGEGAFYGPKIDFHVKDRLGRSWQLGTIQLDFSMPEKFDLTYVDQKGQKQTPAMIHRAITGSLERFIGILLEQSDGALPLWLSPEQVRIIPVSEKYVGYGREVLKQVLNNGWRAELDDSNETLAKKISSAEAQKIPYMLVVGEKEKHEGLIAVRDREKGDLGCKKLDEFFADLKLKIKEN